MLSLTVHHGDHAGFSPFGTVPSGYEGPVVFVKPPALRPSDVVQLVAPAGPFDRESFDRGLAVLASRYRPTFDDGIFARHRYLAGDDARRTQELRSAWSNPDVKAIFAARGGYGVMRLLRSLPLQDLPHMPVIGFSDLTALHLALQKQGRVSIHGPVLTQLGRSGEDVVQRLWKLLESNEPAAPLHGTETYVEGHAEGPLIGGNLSVFSRLLGTPFMPDLTGAILLLEDVGERPYRLDRMWTHLQLAGVFEQVRGIVLGEFTGCEESPAAPRQARGEGSTARGESSQEWGSAEVLRELARDAGLPCAAEFQIGHGDVNLPVPLGVRVRLDADARSLEFLEPAVETNARARA